MTNMLSTGSIRDGFGQGLVEAAQQDPQIVALCADLAESIRMQPFVELFPERFWQVGVAEQNLVGIAAGLAIAGKIPFAGSYAAFSPGRSWDQIRVAVCYSNLNVKIIGGHAGLSVGPDGAVTQALEDISLMRVLPNMLVVVPADQEQARLTTLAIARHQGPCYLRLCRGSSPNLPPAPTEFQLGKAQVLRTGKDISLIACGTMVAVALTTADQLAKIGITATVINMHTIKPLDTVVLEHAARETGTIVTFEDHQVAGGLGSAVSEYLTEHFPVPIIKIGATDTFGESGEPETVLAKYGLTVEHGVEAARRALELKTYAK